LQVTFAAGYYPSSNPMTAHRLCATVVEQPQLPFGAMLAATDKNILVVVVQASSAAIQRGFFLVNSGFTEQQGLSLATRL